jgi:hypothetical protein
MSQHHDLDDALAALRSPATEAELSAEREIVALMVAHHQRAGRGSTVLTSRRARVAVLVTAGVIGFGGVAAAGPSAFDFLGSPDGPTLEPVVPPDVEESEVEESEVEETPAPAEPVDETEGAEGAESPTPDDAEEGRPAPVIVTEGAYGVVGDPDESTEFNESYCVVGSHGATVSAVARKLPPFENVAVVAAAQSSCGTTAPTTTTAPAPEEPVADEPVVDEELLGGQGGGDPDPGPPSGRGVGNGRGQGNGGNVDGQGGGQGNGNGRGPGG